jgi:hypothetical protein
MGTGLWMAYEESNDVALPRDRRTANPLRRQTMKPQKTGDFMKMN